MALVGELNCRKVFLFFYSYMAQIVFIETLWYFSGIAANVPLSSLPPSNMEMKARTLLQLLNDGRADVTPSAESAASAGEPFKSVDGPATVQSSLVTALSCIEAASGARIAA